MHKLPEYVKFLRGSYGESIDYNLQQSDMDNGLKKQRPGRSVPLKIRKGSLVLKGHMARRKFEFWLKSIGNGTQRFEYRDPIEGVVKQCRFVQPKWEFGLQGKDIWMVDVEMESIGE